MATPHRNVLLIEDSESDTDLIREMLGEAATTRFHMDHVTTLADAVQFLTREDTDPDVLLVDLTLPDSTGFHTLEEVRRVVPSTPIVVLTHVDDSEIAVKAVRSGAQDWLTKEYVLSNLLERSLNYAIERNRMESELRRSEELFRQLAENINEVFWLSDAKSGQLIYVSPTYENVWGRSCDALYGNQEEWLEAIHSEERATVSDRIRRNWRSGGEDLDYRITRPDGTICWIHDRGVPIRDADNVIYRIAGTAEDISQRKNLEREIAELSVNEQRRIGHELHDGFGQQLTGIGLLARSLQGKLQSAQSPEAATAADLAENVSVAQRQLRKLVKGLMPVEVDANGLMAALSQLATATERLCNVVCMFDCDRPVAVENATVATHLYHIAQEAVTNAVRHAESRHIWVSLTAENDVIMIQVRDDGMGLGDGFDKSEGMGLRIMRHRAGVVGAALDIRPGEPCGTVITCTLRQGD